MNAANTAQALIESAKEAMGELDGETAHRLYHEALVLARGDGERKSEAQSLLGLANVALHYCPEEDVNPFELREELVEHSLTIFHEVHDQVGIAAALGLKSSCSSPEEAENLLHEAMHISESSTTGLALFQPLNRFP